MYKYLKRIIFALPLLALLSSAESRPPSEDDVAQQTSRLEITKRMILSKSLQAILVTSTYMMSSWLPQLMGMNSEAIDAIQAQELIETNQNPSQFLQAKHILNELNDLKVLVQLYAQNGGFAPLRSKLNELIYWLNQESMSSFSFISSNLQKMNFLLR
jgi:hypothetical protein